MKKEGGGGVSDCLVVTQKYRSTQAGFQGVGVLFLIHTSQHKNAVIDFQSRAELDA